MLVISKWDQNPMCERVSSAESVRLEMFAVKDLCVLSNTFKSKMEIRCTCFSYLDIWLPKSSRWRTQIYIKCDCVRTDVWHHSLRCSQLCKRKNINTYEVKQRRIMRLTHTLILQNPNNSQEHGNVWEMTDQMDLCSHSNMIQNKIGAKGTHSSVPSSVLNRHLSLSVWRKF